MMEFLTRKLTAPIELPKVPQVNIATLTIPIIGLSSLMVVFLLLMAVAGTYMRPIADDYLFVAAIQKFGFWGSQANWYQTWFGRFSSQFVMNLLYTTGYGFVQILPILLMGLWISSVSVVFKTLTKFDWKSSAFSALSVVSLALFLAPEATIGQGLFWSASSLFHTLPLVLAGFILPLFISQNRQPWHLAAAFGFSFFLCGMSEAFNLLFASALLIFALVKRDKYSIAALCGTIISTAIMFASPGNTIRSVVSHGPFSLNESLLVSAKTSYHVLESFSATATILIALACAFLAYKNDTHLKVKPSWFVSLGIAFIAIPFMTITPSVVALKSDPTPRVFFISYALLSLVLVFSAVCAGTYLRRFKAPEKSHLWTEVLLTSLYMLAILTPALLQKGRGLITINQEYATYVVERDEIVKRGMSEGKSTIRIPVVSVYGMDNITANADWKNRSLALYYSRENPSLIIPNTLDSFAISHPQPLNAYHRFPSIDNLLTH